MNRRLVLPLVICCMACGVDAPQAHAAQGERSKLIWPRSEPEARFGCDRHLKAIGRALDAYRRDHKTWPANLSDLYPRYIPDRSIFHCPADRTPGSVDPFAKTRDPKLPNCSYLYELSLVPNGPGPLLGPLPGPAPKRALNWREVKLAQRVYFGDRVPAVSCLHHWPKDGKDWSENVSQLTLSGKIYYGRPGWEWDPDTLVIVIDRLKRDLLAGGPAAGRWTYGSVSGYLEQITNEVGKREFQWKARAQALRASLPKAARALVSASSHAKPEYANQLREYAALFFSHSRDEACAADIVRLLAGDPEMQAIRLAIFYENTERPDRAIRALDGRMRTAGGHPYFKLVQAYI